MKLSVVPLWQMQGLLLHYSICITTCSFDFDISGSSLSLFFSNIKLQLGQRLHPAQNITATVTVSGRDVTLYLFLKDFRFLHYSRATILKLLSFFCQQNTFFFDSFNFGLQSSNHIQLMLQFFYQSIDKC